MLNLARPAFKKKLVKGKSKARTRTDLFEDLDPVALQAKKAASEPDVAPKNATPKVSRWAQYAKLAQAHETTDKNLTVEGNANDTEKNHSSELLKQVEQLNSLGPDGPVLVDSSSTLPQLEPSTAGKVYMAPKTFLLRESHFRDKEVVVEKEYETISDDEAPKVVYEEDDEPMVDHTFVHDIPTRFDLEMYESEIMSMASENDGRTGIKVSTVATREELIASFTQKIQELLLSAQARHQEMTELKLRLDTAVATKKAVLAQLHTLE